MSILDFYAHFVFTRYTGSALQVLCHPMIVKMVRLELRDADPWRDLEFLIKRLWEISLAPPSEQQTLQ